MMLPTRCSNLLPTGLLLVVLACLLGSDAPPRWRDADLIPDRWHTLNGSDPGRSWNRTQGPWGYVVVPDGDPIRPLVAEWKALDAEPEFVLYRGGSRDDRIVLQTRFLSDTEKAALEMRSHPNRRHIWLENPDDITERDPSGGDLALLTKLAAMVAIANAANVAFDEFVMIDDPTPDCLPMLLFLSHAEAATDQPFVQFLVRQNHGLTRLVFLPHDSRDVLPAISGETPDWAKNLPDCRLDSLFVGHMHGELMRVGLSRSSGDDQLFPLLTSHRSGQFRRLFPSPVPDVIPFSKINAKLEGFADVKIMFERFNADQFARWLAGAEGPTKTLPIDPLLLLGP